jgi:hypothetical protein
MKPIEDFIAELRGTRIMDDIADNLEAALRATKTEALTNRHARELLKAVAWIAAHTERSIVERLAQLQRLTSFDRPVVMSMALFTGWT